MKHEIEIPDLPEGWDAVAYRVPVEGEYFWDGVIVKNEFKSGLSIQLAEHDFKDCSFLIVRKKAAAQFVLEETDEDKLKEELPEHPK